jgi:hypothetical protein
LLVSLLSLFTYKVNSIAPSDLSLTPITLAVLGSIKVISIKSATLFSEPGTFTKSPDVTKETKVTYVYPSKASFLIEVLVVSSPLEESILEVSSYKSEEVTSNTSVDPLIESVSITPLGFPSLKDAAQV